jgi:Xaa-Pro aminopeptidase
MREDSVAIFVGNFRFPKSADMFFDYRQNSDLYYLTGVLDEEARLVLWKNADGVVKEYLFIADADEEKALWDGLEPSDDLARETSGVGKVLPVSQFEKLFRRVVTEVSGIYVNLNEHNRFRSQIKNKNQVMAEDLKRDYPGHDFYRSAPLLAELRMKKSEVEIQIMKAACKITGETFKDVCQMLKPGVMEYEVEAEILRGFRSRGASGPAYGSIVASGAKNCVLHYQDNNRECRDGDLLLLDFGCELSGYASDLSRTLPVNGRFSDRQAEVYKSVLSVMQGAKEILGEGVVLNDYHVQVGELMTKELLGLGLLDANEVAGDGGSELYRKYFMHGTSHYIGLDTHDVGRYDVGLPAGAVVTVEPGIYIPEEGFGIRLENDVVIRPAGQGVIDLMDEVPLEISEIESLMKD